MSATETEYVPRELFDIHLQSIRERANSDKELGDERLEKFQAVMEKNFATLQGQINVLSEKIDHVSNTTNEKIDHVSDTLSTKIDRVESTLNEKIDHVADTLNEKIERVESTLNEKIDYVADTLSTKIERVESTINKRIDGLEETVGVAIQGTHERIDSVEKRIDDLHHSQNIWFAVLGFFAAAVPVAIAIIQHIIAK